MSEFSCPHCTSGPFKSMAGLTGHIRFKHSELEEPSGEPADGWGYHGGGLAPETYVQVNQGVVTPPVRIVAEDESLDLRVADMRAQLALHGVDLPDERLRPIAYDALRFNWSEDRVAEALDLELMRNPADREPRSDLTDAQRSSIRELQRQGFAYVAAYGMVTGGAPSPEEVAAHTPQPTDRLDQLREHLRNGGVSFQDALYLHRLAVIGRDAVEMIGLMQDYDAETLALRDVTPSSIVDRWEAAIS